MANYSITGFSYNSVTHTGTWTVAGSIGTDRLHIDLKSSGASAVTDAVGTDLDGEWTDGSKSYPSGNGTAGGDFNFHFNALPGDVTQSGTVNGLDINLVASNWLHLGNVMGDPNGDDVINGLDINTIATHWLAQLPAGGGSASGESVASPSALAVGVSSPAPPNIANIWQGAERLGNVEWIVREPHARGSYRGILGPGGAARWCGGR